MPSSNHKSQNIYYNIFVSRSGESQTLWFQKSKRQNYMGSSWKQEYFQQGKQIYMLTFFITVILENNELPFERKVCVIAEVFFL